MEHNVNPTDIHVHPKGINVSAKEINVKLTELDVILKQIHVYPTAILVNTQGTISQIVIWIRHTKCCIQDTGY